MPDERFSSCNNMIDCYLHKNLLLYYFAGLRMLGVLLDKQL